MLLIVDKARDGIDGQDRVMRFEWFDQIAADLFLSQCGVMPVFEP